MDLCGAGGYHRWTNDGWSWVLELAEEFGWQPVGTGAPPRMKKADWNGVYWSNENQLFYARDAAAMAGALERALDAIPERVEPKRGKLKGRYFVREQVEELREFITFCRAGSFRIC